MRGLQLAGIHQQYHREHSSLLGVLRVLHAHSQALRIEVRSDPWIWHPLYRAKAARKRIHASAVRAYEFLRKGQPQFHETPLQAYLVHRSAELEYPGLRMQLPQPSIRWRDIATLLSDQVNIHSDL